MSEKFLLAIDQGTTSSRAIVFDAAGNIRRGDDDAHGLVDRHHDIVVGGQQARLPGLEVLFLDHQGIEAQIIMVGIFVALPLLAGAAYFLTHTDTLLARHPNLF